MARDFLQFNDTKCEVILVGTSRQIHKAGIDSSAVNGQMGFSYYLFVKTSLYHLRNIMRLMNSLTRCDAEKLIHAFVTSRLVYCNGLLAGLPNKTYTEITVCLELCGTYF